MKQLGDVISESSKRYRPWESWMVWGRSLSSCCENRDSHPPTHLVIFVSYNILSMLFFTLFTQDSPILFYIHNPVIRVLGSYIIELPSHCQSFYYNTCAPEFIWTHLLIGWVLWSSCLPKKSVWCCVSWEPLRFWWFYPLPLCVNILGVCKVLVTHAFFPQDVQVLPHGFLNIHIAVETSEVSPSFSLSVGYRFLSAWINGEWYPWKFRSLG